MAIDLTCYKHHYICMQDWGIGYYYMISFQIEEFLTSQEANSTVPPKISSSYTSSSHMHSEISHTKYRPTNSCNTNAKKCLESTQSIINRKKNPTSAKKFNFQRQKNVIGSSEVWIDFLISYIGYKMIYLCNHLGYIRSSLGIC